MKHGVPSRLGE